MTASRLMTMHAAQGSVSWTRSYTVPSDANFTSAGATHFVTLRRRSQGDYQRRHSMRNVRFTNRVLSFSELYAFPLDMVQDAALCVQGSPPMNLATATPLTAQSPGSVATLQLTSALVSYIP